MGAMIEAVKGIWEKLKDNQRKIEAIQVVLEANQEEMKTG
jgi:hypothetical protein